MFLAPHRYQILFGGGKMQKAKTANPGIAATSSHYRERRLFVAPVLPSFCR
jgi:hypothetical protein